MTNPLAELELAAATIDVFAPVEHVIAAILCLEYVKKAAREAEAALKQRLVEYIQQTGQPIIVGDVKYYAGTERVTECIDKANTMEALYDALDGDFAGVVDLLSAQPFKPGACRDILPAADFDRLFSVRIKERLKEGKPAKSLLKIDQRFVKSQASAGTEADQISDGE